MQSTLDGDKLVNEASRRAALDDRGDDRSYREGLERLLDGLDAEADLGDAGRAAASEVILHYLTKRLQVLDWHDRHTDIADGEVAAPLFMIGMGRTGTTILHDLLGCDPAHRVPRTWEVDRPSPPPEAATYTTDARIAESQAAIDAADRARPDIRAMHPRAARLGQECICMTGCELKSAIFLSQFASPSYMRWLTDEADLAPAYRWHRRFLQLLQWRNPGGRWVLKSGAHLWALPALVAEYPDASFVQTHRDPVRVIGSISSLFAAIHGSFSPSSSIERVAAQWADPVLDALDRSVDARESGLVAPDRVVDVQFSAFMADPFGTMAGIYDRLGEELTPEAEQRMRAFLGENPRDKHGVHRYSFADTGLDVGEIRERSRRYCEYFDVAPEPVP